jgi:hypothetical protein
MVCDDECAKKLVRLKLNLNTMMVFQTLQLIGLFIRFIATLQKCYSISSQPTSSALNDTAYSPSLVNANKRPSQSRSSHFSKRSGFSDSAYPVEAHLTTQSTNKAQVWLSGWPSSCSPVFPNQLSGSPMRCLLKETRLCGEGLRT